MILGGDAKKKFHLFARNIIDFFLIVMNTVHTKFRSLKFVPRELWAANSRTI